MGSLNSNAITEYLKDPYNFKQCQTATNSQTFITQPVASWACVLSLSSQFLPPPLHISDLLNSLRKPNVCEIRSFLFIIFLPTNVNYWSQICEPPQKKRKEKSDLRCIKDVVQVTYFHACPVPCTLYRLVTPLKQGNRVSE